MSGAALESREISLEIDFLKEIQLRTWARKHYTQAENRDHRWHPIVLDEMSRRDRELCALS